MSRLSLHKVSVSFRGNHRPRSYATVAAIVLLFTLYLPYVFARAANDAEKEAISQTVDTFHTAFQKGEYDKVFSLSLPPKLINAIGKKFGVASDVLRASVLSEMTKVMNAVRFEAFSMTPSAAAYGSLPDGTPFAFIPTSVIITAYDQKFSFKGVTLALLDEGKWWLIRIEDQQLPLLLEAYPEFSQVNFPRETMEITKP